MRPGGWPQYGSAGLCAVGMTLGLLRVAEELSQHLPSARDVSGLMGIALGAGVVLGLWLPQWLIRRRLGSAGGWPADRTPTPEPEFAASLVGLLVLALAALSAVLAVVLTGAESYRGWLTLRFLHPPWLTRVLLTAPLAAGLVLTAAAGAVVLTALHGWHRVLRGPDARAAALWITLLGTASVAAAAVAATPRPQRLDFVALLALFSAAALAVWRRSSSSPRAQSHPVGSGVARAPTWPLLTVGAAAAATGLALVVAAPAHPIVVRPTAGILALFGGSALVGVLVTSWLAAGRGPGVGTLAWLLLALAVTWGMPTGGADFGAARLVLTAGLATACVVAVGRRLTRAYGRAPPALVAVGVVGVAGFGLGTAAGPLLRGALDSPAVPVIVSLALTALTGLAWVYARAASSRRRTLGLAAAGVWLLVLLLVPPAPPADAPGPTMTAVAPLDLAFGAAGESAAWRATGAPTSAAWRACDVDLGGPRLDLLILSGPDMERRSAARLVRRCTRALLPGGRLALVDPPPTLCQAAFDVFRRRLDGAAEAVLVCRRGPEPPASVLLFGRDAAAWLRTRRAEAAPDAELYVVDDADAVRRLLADRAGPRELVKPAVAR